MYKNPEITIVLPIRMADKSPGDREVTTMIQESKSVFNPKYTVKTET